jgi:hypothetical protein
MVRPPLEPGAELGGVGMTGVVVTGVVVTGAELGGVVVTGVEFGAVAGLVGCPSEFALFDAHPASAPVARAAAATAATGTRRGLIAFTVDRHVTETVAGSRQPRWWRR